MRHALNTWWQAVCRRYEAALSIGEIRDQTILQWSFGALIFAHFIAFYDWIDSNALTLEALHNGTYRCWPYFQGCGDWYFLHNLPYGYSQTTLYMGLFALLALAVYCMHARKWVYAHMALMPAFLWHAVVLFILTESLGGNYEYYLFFFGFILLFLPHKEFFLKLTLVAFYFLSTVAKMHPAWILGTYFSSLKTGLPIFPDWSIPLLTSLVIGMEMVASWYLLSSRKIVQRVVFAFFVVFHLYSGILVEYRYPATVMPFLLILFGPLYRYTPVPLDKKSLAGWTMIVIMGMLQFSPVLIPGDEKLTMEGNKFGLYMFDANHQCISTTKTIYNDGTATQNREDSVSARERCDPYKYWFAIQARCKSKSGEIQRIEWVFDHSINGGPFLRIVDSMDACKLTYNAFSHNAWIKTETDHPPVIGYPVENIYR